MTKPDWLSGLSEEDPDCKEGLYIFLPPNSEKLCDDNETGVAWHWDVIEPGLLELIACGPPPNLMEMSILESLTSFPCFRFYVARHTGDNLRVAVVMDKLIADVFRNIGHILKVPFAKKYVNAWLRGYHPNLTLVLNGITQGPAQGISLVWTRPSWARRPHWVLTSVLDMADDELTRERAAAITQESRFKKVRYAQRNLLAEDVEYLTPKGFLKGTGRVAFEGLEELAKTFAEETVKDALDELLGDYYDSGVDDRVGPLGTSFRKPDLFTGFEDVGKS